MPLENFYMGRNILSRSEKLLLVVIGVLDTTLFPAEGDFSLLIPGHNFDWDWILIQRFSYDTYLGEGHKC